MKDQKKKNKGFEEVLQDSAKIDGSPRNEHVCVCHMNPHFLEIHFFCQMGGALRMQPRAKMYGENFLCCLFEATCYRVFVIKSGIRSSRGEDFQEK